MFDLDSAAHALFVKLNALLTKIFSNILYMLLDPSALWRTVRGVDELGITTRN